MRLARRLHASGEPVECVFLFGGGPLLEELNRDGVPWRVLRRPGNPSTRRSVRVFTSLVAVARLGWLLRRRRPAVVMAWLTFATWPTLLLAELLTSAARVAGIRGEILPTEVRWASRLFRRALRRADAVVVNSNALLAEATSWGAAQDSVKVIPNGVDPATQVSDPRSRSAVVVANYRPYKGHVDLLRALALCNTDASVRLCGSGDGRRDVENLAAELSLLERVHFIPEPADIALELGRAGFAIHPSRSEGLSNAILEEMAAGLPVIAMSVGGNPMLVEHDVNGYLLDVGDHISLARAIDELSSDTELRRRLGAGSRRKVEQFSWAECTVQYQQLLRQLEADNSKSPTGARA